MAQNTGRSQGQKTSGSSATSRPLPHLAGRLNPSVESNQQGKTNGNLARVARSSAAKSMAPQAKKQEGE